MTAKHRRRTVDPLIHQLRARRLALGYTTVEAGRRAGVSPDTIRHIEDGWSSGTLPTLRAYATAVGADLQVIDQERQPDDRRTI